MGEFNYDIKITDHYYIDELTVYGKSVQDGTPSLESHVDVEVLEPEPGEDAIGLTIGGETVPLELLGNFVANVPNGTRDVLEIDENGNCTLTKRIGKYTVTGDETVSGQTQLTSYRRVVLSNVVPANEACTAAGSSSGLCDYVPYENTTGAGSGMHVAMNNRNLAIFAVGDTAEEVIEQYIGATIYYNYAAEKTIDLGQIVLPENSNVEYTFSVYSPVNPETAIVQHDVKEYEVENPYEDYNAPEYAYPPNHFGQDWETFDANDWNETDMLDYTGQFESHAVYTVELCELMQSGAFDWKRPEIDWSEAAYDNEQYERFCSYFEQRFMFREIGILPPLQWFAALKRMMVYELMPKYKPLYAQVESGIAPLGENEYYKERKISSAYPETLLSGNSDYISDGEDREWERVKVNNAAEALESYRNGYRSVDAALADELEVLFISMYTSYANVL